MMMYLPAIIILLLIVNLCQAGWHFEAHYLDQYCRLNGEHNGYCKVARSPSDSNCFRAAVYEHNRKEREDANSTIEANLDIFEKVTRLASKDGANIIVFPEDGIVYGIREMIEEISEDIPDPMQLNRTNNNPCNQQVLYRSNNVLRRFSCMAQANNLYLVANYPTKQVCDPAGIEPNQVCPPKGHLVLNTDVVLDPRGNFIGRYRKYNRFLEPFDKPPSLELVYFDTPYGRFGVFTCFDIIFKKPAVELVQKYQIDTAIFPTLWYDELPHLTAIQFQDAWSWANNVNLLASNMFNRAKGTVGSGIYSAHSAFHTMSSNSESKLLIANVPKKYSYRKCSGGIKGRVIPMASETPAQTYSFIQFKLLPTDSFYQLTSTEDIKTVCSGRVCCTLSYKLSGELSSANMVMIVRDANRPGYFNWFEQICSLVTLEKPINLNNLDDIVYADKTLNTFAKLSIEGTFSTKYVYPISAHNIDQLVERDERSFSCNEESNQRKCQLTFDGAKERPRPVYSFALYGRVYEHDKMPQGW